MVHDVRCCALAPKLLLDAGSSPGGGASLTIAGTLANYGDLQIGSIDGGLDADDVIHALSLLSAAATKRAYLARVAQPAWLPPDRPSAAARVRDVSFAVSIQRDKCYRTTPTPRLSRTAHSTQACAQAAPRWGTDILAAGLGKPSVGAVDWDREAHSGAIWRTRRRPQATAMPFDDRSADRKPHAETLGFCREERFEEALRDGRVESRARVFDRNQHAAGLSET